MESASSQVKSLWKRERKSGQSLKEFAYENEANPLVKRWFDLKAGLLEKRMRAARLKAKGPTIAAMKASKLADRAKKVKK